MRVSPNPANQPAVSVTTDTPEPTDSMISIDSFHTASGDSVLSLAGATEGGSTLRALPDVDGNGDTARPRSNGLNLGYPSTNPSSPMALLHRFTLIKPGAKRSTSGSPNMGASAPLDIAPTWSPFDFFFSSGLLVARCDLCTKRLGWKPVLECDDCGLR